MSSTWARSVRRCVVAVVLGVAALTACQPVPHLDLTVNTAGDAGDANVGDSVCEATPGLGDCTLRAAISETNAASSYDIVRIATGIEPALATPPPPITGSLTIYGNGTTLHQHIQHNSGTLTLHDLTISGASAPSGCGGAITSVGTSLSLIDVKITGNATAGNHGGGICSTANLAVTGSTIANNRVTGAAAGSGGGIFATHDVTLTGVAITGNSVDNGPAGKGVAVSGTGHLTVLLSTVAGNLGYPIAGTAVDAPSATGSVTASTILGTSSLSSAVTVSASVIGPCSTTSAPTSGGYNYLTGTTCGPATATDLTGAAPEVSALADNGGPTATVMPAGPSPLLDRIPPGTPGLCDGSVPVDQRGTSRPANGKCDIGSVEVQSNARFGPVVGIDNPPMTGAQGDVLDVNDAGVAVGDSWPIPVPFHDRATRWSANGTRTDLGTLGPADGISGATGINSSGVIVGWSQTTAGPNHAFRRNPNTGVMVDLGTLAGDTSSGAIAVNKAGTIVGYSTNAAGVDHPVMWNATTLAITQLPTLGGTTAAVVALNDSGIAVGSSGRSTGDDHAARWDLSADTVSDLGTVLGGTYSAANAINSAGTIVGVVGRPDLPDTCVALGFGGSCPETRGFVWTAANGMTQLPGDIGPLGDATVIDDRGHVLVTATYYFVSCSHCPMTSTETYLVDTNTSEHLLVSNSQFAPTAISGTGKVVGIGRYEDQYVYYDSPLTTTINNVP